MSTPAHSADRRGVPAPPGGHALRIDPDAPRPLVPHAQAPLPVVEEVSAGGVVVEILGGTAHAAVIARRNRGGRLEWCLPKGHLEGTETPEEAAVREIAEETGISGTVQTPLGIIDYWFTGDDRRVHKVVHHFLLRATGGFLTVEGDPDGEAEDVAWIAMDDLPARLSYPNERRLAAAADDVLHGRRRTSRFRGTVTRTVVTTRPAPPSPRSSTDHP
ncbi:NUDIX hydrolase [Oerskovia flava]|uniref:NUDIX hydrolase n=1 Tax=Oerskovia flava TaxID=2986422 RepID=UPI00223FCA1C|nr:NUDIX hydrolase [Oerskovia sp. JB1-3-2]